MAAGVAPAGPERIAARYARGTVTGWTIFFGAWVAVGVVMTVVGLVLAMLPVWLMGLVLTAPFLGLLIFARRRLADPRPVITLGPEGFHDRRLGPAIPWTEITGLRRHQPGNRIFLLIEAERPARFLKDGFMSRRMLATNPRMGFPVLVSSLSALDLPQERLAEAAAAWMAAR